MRADWLGLPTLASTSAAGAMVRAYARNREPAYPDATEGLDLPQPGKPADCIVVVELAQNAVWQSQSLHLPAPV